MNSPFLALMKVQAISSGRSFPSIFYSVVLPAFLFIVFGLVFGVDAEYAAFFLPGMMGVMVTSDALYAVGPVIKAYHQQGIFREFKTYPVPTAWLFISFILARLVVVCISSALLITLSAVLFGYLPSLETIALYALGIILGFMIYSLIALMISFAGITDNRDQGFISVLYFGGMFLSDAYMRLSTRGVLFDIIGYVFPLKPVLQVMRGDLMALPIVGCWLAASFVLYLLVINRARFQRA